MAGFSSAGQRLGRGVRHAGPRFGKAAPAIDGALEKAGYRRAADPEGFIVAGKFGPLRDGELDRARRWGAQLAAVVEAGAAHPA